MNDQSQHINPYTAADIQRYLNGNMSATEMNAMEKAALDDPFLADAIDGMEQTLQLHDSSVIDTNLQEIRSAVAEKIKPSSGKIRSMVWWRMAAAALVVVVAGLFLWNNLNDKDNVSAQQKDIAAVQTVPKPDTAPAPPAATPQAGPTLARKAAPPAADAFSTMDKSAALQEKITLADGKPISLDTFKTVPGLSQANRAELANQLTELNFRDTIGRPLNTEVVQVPGHSRNILAVNPGTSRYDKKLNNVIRGRVIDNLYKPLANAYVQTQDQSNLTYFTDREGFFNIPTKETDTTLKVSVTAVGFSTRQFQLNKDLTANQLQLEPAGKALQEVVVSGYGNLKKGNMMKKVRETDMLNQNAEPVYGWVGYEKYLKENIRIPVVDSIALSGDVVVSFSVSRRGQLSDFNIVRSLSPTADKEAVRLITEGPTWKIKHGRKATATVIVHF